MFPTEPALLRQKMAVSNFRMSQVGGHTPKASKRSANGVRTSKVSCRDWILTGAQETQRQQQFGNLHELLLLGCDNRRCFPLSIRREYLKARQRSVVTKLYSRDGSESELSVGSCSRFLKNFERKYRRLNKTLTLSPLDEALAELRSSQRVTTDCIEPVNDDASMKLREKSAVASVHSDNFDVDDLTSDPREAIIDVDDSLDDIFGRGNISHNYGVDVNQLLFLFDSDVHYCAVSPPLEYAVSVSNESECDESDSVSVRTKSSQLSVNTINDDLLCDFFESRECRLRKPLIAQNHVTEKIDGKSCDQRDDLNFGGDRPFENDFNVDDCAENQAKETKVGKSCDEQEISDYGSGNVFVHSISNKTNEDENADDIEPPLKRCLSTPRDFSRAESERIRSLHKTETLARRQVCSDNHDIETVEQEENARSGSHSQPRLGTNKNTESPRKDLPVFLDAAFSSEELSSNMLCSRGDVAANSVVALQLPTPPDSSDDSDDDSITDNASIVSFFAPRADGSGNSEALRPFDSDDQIDQTSCSHVVPLQLPTQYSSSSSDDDSNDEVSLRCQGRAANGDKLNKSTQSYAQKDLHKDVNNQHSQSSRPETCEQLHPPSSLKNITNLERQSQSDVDLVDTPTPKDLKLNSASTNNMSPDDLIDTPIDKGPNKAIGLEPRLSADGLTDTPIKQSEVSVRGPKRKRLRPAACDDKENQHTSTATLIERRERVKQRIEEKYRCKFFDTEAVLDGSDEDSDEEEAIKQIEEEESHNSFINDSSQLGYTQDDLDQINADEEVREGLIFDDSLLHRQLNHQQNVAEQFKTPIFNRRMMRPSLSQNIPSSQRGLGNMNFIRSILEHHRQGGDSDEIEEEYHRLIGRCSPNESHDWSSPISIVDSPVRPSQHVASHNNNLSVTSNSNDQSHATRECEDRHSCTLPPCEPLSHSKSEPPLVLTADQKAMIEAKRLAALKRRQERQQQILPRANPYVR